MVFKEFPFFISRIPSIPFQDLSAATENYQMLLNTFNKELLIQQAIYLESPNLYYELKKLVSQKKYTNKKDIKYLNTLAKYIIRMTTRCTPFGLFSGCFTGQIDLVSKMDIKSDRRYSPRLDMELLYQFNKEISKISSIRNKLLYYPNPTLYSIAKKKRFYESKDLKDGSFLLSEIPNSTALNKILKRCITGAYINEIILVFDKNDFNNEELIEYVNDLVDCHVLVDELYFPTTGDDLLDRILNKYNHKKSSLLFEIKTCLENIQNNNIDAINSFSKINNIVSEINPSFNKAPLQIDLFFNVHNATLGKHILDELKTLLSFLNKLLPNIPNYRLSHFIHKFTHKFDRQEVPLLEALDPDYGINYSTDPLQGYNSELLYGINKINRSQDPKDQIETKITNLNYNKSQKEVVLNDKLVNDSTEDWKFFSETIYAFFSLVENEKGEQVILFKNFSGDSAAKLLGRFTSGNEEIYEIAKKINTFERHAYENSILAEIVHLSEAKTGNVIYRKHLRDYEITVNGSSDLNISHTIPVSDIMISIKNNKVVLRSKKLNKIIIPKLTNAHNYENSKFPIYKFLCDVSRNTSHSELSLINYIRVNEDQRFQPRFVYRNIILSPAMWFINTSDLQHILKEDNNKYLMPKIRKWRKDNSLPQKVNILYKGVENYLDFENEICIKSITSIVNKHKDLIFIEFLSCSKMNSPTHNGKSFMNEFIVPFYKSYEN